MLADPTVLSFFIPYLVRQQQSPVLTPIDRAGFLALSSASMKSTSFDITVSNGKSLNQWQQVLQCAVS